MKLFNIILKHKYWWFALLILFAGTAYLSSFLNYKIDLTAEKRYSLTEATKKLLQNIDTTVTIKIFLTGNLPADYKKLQISLQDLLDEFRDVSNNAVKVVFQKPAVDLKDSILVKAEDSSIEARNEEDWKYIIGMYWIDSLRKMGVGFDEESLGRFANRDKETSFSDIIIPSALVYYKNLKPFAVDLRSSRTIYKTHSVINDNADDFIDKEATLNAAEALLEFNFANAIDKLTRKYVPTIAYLIGNGEAGALKVNDLIQSLRNEYRLGVFDLKQSYPDAAQINALLIVKPTQPFTDEDKLKIDQYIMHGGKVIWCIDKLYAELDSLMRSKADFIAFDRNLNIDDLLFHYGVRINGDLVQDLNCAKLPVVIGQNPDGSPRMQRIPWPYYPFISSVNDNFISKNLDRVLTIFPSSIDTIKAPGIEKTILLATDTNSRKMSSPALVSLNSVQSDEDFRYFNKSHVPIAVLLQGKFHSLFANRLTQQEKDSIQTRSGKVFAEISDTTTKQIVVSDADIVTNAYSETAGPLPMGELPLENFRFANREFFLNCIDYLISNNALFEARNKNFTLRLLDKKKVAEEKIKWQFINIALPVLLIILFGLCYQWKRKMKYTT